MRARGAAASCRASSASCAGVDARTGAFRRARRASPSSSRRRSLRSHSEATRPPARGSVASELVDGGSASGRPGRGTDERGARRASARGPLRTASARLRDRCTGACRFPDARDPELRGWGWTGDTRSFVEPTSRVLIATKRLAPSDRRTRDDATRLLRGMAVRRRRLEPRRGPRPRCEVAAATRRRRRSR